MQLFYAVSALDFLRVIQSLFQDKFPHSVKISMVMATLETVHDRFICAFRCHSIVSSCLQLNSSNQDLQSH